MKKKLFLLGALALVLAFSAAVLGCENATTTEYVNPAPGGVSVVTAGNGRLVVKWDAASNATGYSVYHGQSDDSKTATSAGTTTETTYTITGLTNGVKYYVWVQASFEDGGTSPRGGGASGTPVAATVPPAAPATPAATASFGYVTLTWPEVSEAASYKVYRAPNVSDTAGTYTLIGTPNAATYRDSSILLPNTVYWYTVAADNDLGTSAQSTGTSVTTQAAAALTANTWTEKTLVNGESHLYTFSIPAGATYRVQWNDAGEGDNTKTANVSVAAYDSTQYLAYITSGGTAPTPLFSTTTSGWTTPQTITVTPATDVLLLVTNSGSTGGTYAIQFYDPANAALPPQTAPAWYTTPLYVTLDNDLSGSGYRTGIIAVEVDWNSFSGATGYNVYRSTNPTSGFSKIHEERDTIVAGVTIPASTSYTDTSLTAGATYYYAVSANGEGPKSAPRSVTVPTSLTLPEGTQFTGSVPLQHRLCSGSR